MYTLIEQSETVLNATKADLRELCKKYGIKNYGRMNNAQMRTAVDQKTSIGIMLKQAVKQIAKVDETAVPFNSWSLLLTPTLHNTSLKKVAKKQTAKKQRVRNDQTHPKSGGKTYAVWVQMRYQLVVRKLPLKQAKVAVREWGKQNNQMKNMVNAQIYRYCKYYGLLTRN